MCIRDLVSAISRPGRFFPRHASYVLRVTAFRRVFATVPSTYDRLNAVARGPESFVSSTHSLEPAVLDPVGHRAPAYPFRWWKRRVRCR